MLPLVFIEPFLSVCLEHFEIGLKNGVRFIHNQYLQFKPQRESQDIGLDNLDPLHIVYCTLKYMYFKVQT